MESALKVKRKIYISQIGEEAQRGVGHSNLRENRSMRSNAITSRVCNARASPIVWLSWPFRPKLNGDPNGVNPGCVRDDAGEEERNDEASALRSASARQHPCSPGSKFF